MSIDVQAQVTPRVEFTRRLSEVLGAQLVLTGAAMIPFATDVYRSRCMPLAVVQPGTVDDLQAVMRACSIGHIAIFVRGGGAFLFGCLLSSSRSARRVARAIAVSAGCHRTNAFVEALKRELVSESFADQCDQAIARSRGLDEP